MIRISLGNVGSGKTACEVRELIHNRTNRLTFSNIMTKGIKNNKVIDPTMIVGKQLVGEKKKKDGSLEPIYELKLNVDFWKNIDVPCNVVLDEAHSIINSRRSMSKVNQIVTDWIALIRRVLGASESGHGELVLITQLPNRIDVIARDMANQVRYHRYHYLKTCSKCNYTWKETNDHPEMLWVCPLCNDYRIKKHSHRIEVWHFKDMNSYNAWNEFGINTYHKHYFVNDIEKVFPCYNTLQWDNMFSELY